MANAWTKGILTWPPWGSGPALVSVTISMGAVLAMAAVIPMAIADVASRGEPMKWWNIRAGILFLSFFAIPTGLFFGVFCAPFVAWLLWRKQLAPAILISFAPALITAVLAGASISALSAFYSAAALIGGAAAGRFVLSDCHHQHVVIYRPESDLNTGAG